MQMHFLYIIFKGFPNVIGAVDGTLVEIHKPWVNASDYILRKRKPHLNVMVSILLKFLRNINTFRIKLLNMEEVN